MHIHTPVVQIVGYKNAGKTTLASRLICLLNERDIKTATIKHHGHGGDPEISGTDTGRHLAAGAVCAAVKGESRWQLEFGADSDFNWDDVIGFYQKIGVDLILVEGFKNLDFPKIVLLRDEADADLLSLGNIIAVGGWSKPPADDGDLFTFSLEGFPIYEQGLLEQIMGRCE